MVRQVSSALLAATIWLVAAGLVVSWSASATHAASQTEHQTVVSNLRVGQHPDKTRIVLDLSDPVTFSIFLLPDPYRVVIDLPELSFKLPGSARSRQVGAVGGWRYGQFRPGTSRVVIDTDHPMTVKASFVLPPSGAQGHRLVVDLEKATRPAFLQASATSIQQRTALSAPRISPPPAAPTPIPKSDDRMVIVVDAGHGGIDPGAIGLSGIYEKTIALEAAHALRDALERTGRYKVVLTRGG